MNRCQIIRGALYPILPWYKRENIEKSMDYIPKNGDIIIVSYPMTGTHWLQYIVLQITSKGEYFPYFSDSLLNVVPYMELTGPEVIENMKGLRIYMNHFSYDILYKNSKSKVLYIYRNPEDTLVSWYHHLQNFRGDPIILDDYFEAFIRGEVEFGDYFDHVFSYLAHKDDDNLLLVSYEKLLANRKEEILRIAKFLGEEFYQNLSDNESLLEKILEQTSFDFINKNLFVTIPQDKTSEVFSDGPRIVIDFFRKGIAVDGKKTLFFDQLKRMQKRVSETMNDTEVLKEWLHE